MLTEEKALKLASDWVHAWNVHDLDLIMTHYHDEVVLVSPVAAQLLNDPTGTIRGKAAVRSYFEMGLEAYPDLRFELIDVLWGLGSVVLYYRNQRGTKTSEFMELDPSGQVRRVVANYSR